MWKDALGVMMLPAAVFICGLGLVAVLFICDLVGHCAGIKPRQRRTRRVR